jgi:hypothetical protein
MDLPPSSHFIYIPLILVLGLVFGFIWGAKSTQEAFRLEARRTEELAKKKAERKAAREAAAGNTTAAAAENPAGGAEKV